ncbi:unnamed protein product [Paramecium pentaurelia]|uniref:Tetratricopeptide repeat protein n=1 Tax=Paramecium pentaurelia TaxID=43138 RepID=A0A8S1VJU2_9CILI|nr:unnamed protein product [Paramecium pentaurelia]
MTLIEMNQPRKDIKMREQAKQINSNLYTDFLDYSNIELTQNPQNAFVLIPKSYALNEEKKYQEAIQQCDKNLIEEPQHLHALYRKRYHILCTTGFTLQDLNQHQQSIQCIEKASNSDLKYSIGYMMQGYSLQSLGKQKDAIDCYDKAIQLDPNYASAYFNKGYLLTQLKKYQQAKDIYEQTVLYCKLEQNQ